MPIATNEVKAIISGEDKLSPEMEKAQKSVDNFGKEVIQTEKESKKSFSNIVKSADKLSNKLKSFGKSTTISITTPLVIAGGAAFKMAADFQDAMGAVDQIFVDSSDDMKNWAKNLKTYYGISQEEALRYTTTMGSMLKNIGDMTEEQAAKQSQILLELAGDLTAMYGGTAQDAVRALTGALKGNNTMLDNYGMAVNESLIKTRAMELGLIKEGEALDLTSKQAATLSLIMEQTADAQGQAAREADGASGTMRAFTTEVKNLSKDIGTVLLPVITPLIQKVRDGVQWFSSLGIETQKTILVVAGLAAAAGPLAIALSSIITVTTTMAKVFMIFRTVSIVQMVTSLGVLSKALLALASNPIVLLIAGVVMLGIKMQQVARNFDIQQGKMTQSVIEHTNNSRLMLKNIALDHVTLRENIEQIEQEIVKAKEDGRDAVVAAKDEERKIMLAIEKMGAKERLEVLAKELEAKRAISGDIRGRLQKLQEESASVWGVFGSEERNAQVQIEINNLKQLERGIDANARARRDIETTGEDAFNAKGISTELRKVGTGLKDFGGTVTLPKVTQNGAVLAEDGSLVPESFYEKSNEGINSNKIVQQDYFNTLNDNLATTTENNAAAVADFAQQGDTHRVDMTDTADVNTTMTEKMMEANDNLLSNIRNLVKKATSSYEQLRNKIQQIKAITAPDDGPDNRTLPQVSAQFGLTDPTVGAFVSRQEPQTVNRGVYRDSAQRGATTSSNVVNDNRNIRVEVRQGLNEDQESLAQRIANLMNRDIGYAAMGA